MYFKANYHQCALIKKSLLFMKITTILLFSACLTASAGGLAQKVTLSVKNAKLEKVFKEIKKQTGYVFFYDTRVLQDAKRVSVSVKNESVDDVLKESLRGQPLDFSIARKTITIFQKAGYALNGMQVSFTTPIVAFLPPDPVSIINGTVRDAQGNPLGGVSVIVKGTIRGTSTSTNGSFSIEANAGDVLELTIVGYKKKSITVEQNNNINVVMEIEASIANEVVVVGYGTQKKINLTGAVGTVKSEDLVRRPVSNIQQALQGQLPGLTILDLGGAPGKSNATIRVRGITTLGDNNPLIIVDGIEQRFSEINPNDIESVSVLKDASSAAIYGSRAANGVLLITTKKGKSGKLAVSYHGYYALQKSINEPEHMGLESYMRMMNVNHVNAGLAPKYTEEYIQEYVNATDRYKYPLPNTWFKTLFSVAPQQDHSLAISGGNENIRTRLSIRYQDQDAIVPNSGSKISGIRLNTDFKISSKINISTDINYRYKNYTSLVNDDNRYENIYNRMFHSSQWATPKFPDGEYGLSAQGHNPLMYAEIAGVSKTAEDYLVGNVKGDWQIVKGLKFSIQFGGQLYNAAIKAFSNKYEVRDYYNQSIIKKSVPLNSLTETRNSSREYTLNNLLTYSRTFENHSLNVLAGYSMIGNTSNTLNAFRQDFYNNDIQSISQGAPNNTRNNGGSDSQWGLRSYFGRLNYSFREKYLFEANSRYDGSSRFMDKNRYGFFPSFSTGWRISKEKFWDKLRNTVNEMKLRGSWGKTGNQAVSLYSYFPTLNLVNYTFNGVAAPGYAQLNLTVPDITWETTTQSNIGLDAQWFDNKISLTIDYYKKRTEGILLTLPVPATLGLNASPQNAGIVDNKGWEFSVGTTNNMGQFSLQANLNVSINDNKVISLAGTGPYITGTDVDPVFIIAEGLPVNAHWGYKTGGLFQSLDEISKYPTLIAGTKPGDVKYLDLNGDGIINGNDRTYLGNSFPKYTYGASFNLAYKGFSLNMMFQGAAQVKTRLAGALAEMGNNEAFTHAIFTNNYWTPEHTNARFPRPIYSDLRNQAPSDRMLINGDYLRLKNIQILYQFPFSLAKKLSIERISIYLSGTNLLTFSKLNEWNLDPETPSGRATYYPQTALYTFGLNLDF